MNLTIMELLDMRVNSFLHPNELLIDANFINF